MTGDEAARLCLHEGLHRGEMRQVSPRGSAIVYKRYLKHLGFFWGVLGDKKGRSL